MKNLLHGSGASIVLAASLAMAMASALSLSNVNADGASKERLSHLRQRPTEHVMLEAVRSQGGCGPSQIDFLRVLPNGTTETGPAGGGYRIPAGKLLVVTDVDWQYRHPDGEKAAQAMQILRLVIENLSNPTLNRRAVDSTIKLSRKGEGGTSESMTSGIVVSSEARICPDIFPGPMGPPFGLQHLILRGYLIEEK